MMATIITTTRDADLWFWSKYIYLYMLLSSAKLSVMRKHVRNYRVFKEFQEHTRHRAHDYTPTLAALLHMYQLVYVYIYMVYTKNLKFTIWIIPFRCACSLRFANLFLQLLNPCGRVAGESSNLFDAIIKLNWTGNAFRRTARKNTSASEMKLSSTPIVLFPTTYNVVVCTMHIYSYSSDVEPWIRFTPFLFNFYSLTRTNWPCLVNPL